MSRCPISPLFSFLKGAMVSIFLLLLSLLPCLAVEDLTVNVPYPLASPSDLFPHIGHLKYIPTSTIPYQPIALLSGELDVNRQYNIQLNALYRFKGLKHRIGALKSTLSALPDLSKEHIHSNFLFGDDSVSLHYDRSNWFNLARTLYGATSRFDKTTALYQASLSTCFRRSDDMNDYRIEARYHRSYGYANMLSFETMYERSPYFYDRECRIIAIVRDRFVFSDFFFFTPGIKAEFLSQTYFTPILSVTFLATKHLSLSCFAEGKALHNGVEKPYQSPFFVNNDSLKNPLNTFSVTLENAIMVDTSISTKVSTCIRKTENSVAHSDYKLYYLQQLNLDTTIIFSDTEFHLLFSKALFDFSASFSASITPFYDETIAYHPRYTYSFSFRLKPSQHIRIGTDLNGSSKMYSNVHGEIGAHALVASSIHLIPSRHFSIALKGINVMDHRERFMNGVSYPGRIITSEVTLQF